MALRVACMWPGNQLMAMFFVQFNSVQQAAVHTRSSSG